MVGLLSLDDFPSPVPSGDGTYVKRDYGTSIQEFYSNIWWPDMLNLASKYGLKYTGVMIENYEDKTDGEITKQTDNERFQYFGNMVLHQGGELGYHGYNHQPLCLGDTDYGDVLPYKTWKNEKQWSLLCQNLCGLVKKCSRERRCRSMFLRQMCCQSRGGRCWRKSFRRLRR